MKGEFGKGSFGKKDSMNDTGASHDHTGSISHGNAHLGTHKGKDSHAHPSHHAMNKEHGGGGFNPADEYEGGGEGENEECC